LWVWGGGWRGARGGGGRLGRGGQRELPLRRRDGGADALAERGDVPVLTRQNAEGVGLVAVEEMGHDPSVGHCLEQLRLCQLGSRPHRPERQGRNSGATSTSKPTTSVLAPRGGSGTGNVADQQLRREAAKDTVPPLTLGTGEGATCKRVPDSSTYRAIQIRDERRSALQQVPRLLRQAHGALTRRRRPTTEWCGGPVGRARVCSGAKGRPQRRGCRRR